jgi:hypothetical protein
MPELIEEDKLLRWLRSGGRYPHEMIDMKAEGSVRHLIEGIFLDGWNGYLEKTEHLLKLAEG